MAQLTHLAPGMRVRNATVRVRLLAERQWGVVSRRQLQQGGLTGGDISRWISQGRLLRVHPGVYALGHRTVPLRGRLVAALLYAGRGAALSHRTAAKWWGLIERGSPAIHVIAPGRRRSIPGVVVHHPRSVKRAFHNGLPVTPVAQTILDIAADAEDLELRKALAEADFQRRLDPHALRSVMGRGRPGSARLRKAIDVHMPELARTLSPLEDLLLLLCEREGIPLPQPNAKVAEYMPDALWPSEMVIVEADGGGAHSSPSQRRRDAERDMRLRSLGYLVLRYTWWQVTRRPTAVAAEILAALAARRPVN